MLFPTLFLYGLTIVLYADAVSILSCPEQRDPKIRVFCIHSSDTTYKETSVNDKDLAKKVNLKQDFAFYVHGWQSEFSFDKKDSTSYKIGLAWVKAKKTNFCGVDWRDLACDGYYDASQKYVKVVGKLLASFLTKLKELKVNMNSISIAGHSLGAHVAGFAGKIIFDTFKTKISTIFGLDPAGPFFTSALVIQSDFHLNKDNEKFVQVLHTASSTYGTSELLGHADYFANGGKQQKACFNSNIKKLLFACSHSHANVLFLYSFTQSCTGVSETKSDSGFMANVVSFFSKSKGGPDVYGIRNHGVYGKFELTTSESEPYCDEL